MSPLVSFVSSALYFAVSTGVRLVSVGFSASTATVSPSAVILVCPLAFFVSEAQLANMPNAVVLIKRMPARRVIFIGVILAKMNKNVNVNICFI
ncbi:hypothetical protein D3C86_1583960 [compost metagenome]